MLYPIELWVLQKTRQNTGVIGRVQDVIRVQPRMDTDEEPSPSPLPSEWVEEQPIICSAAGEEPFGTGATAALMLRGLGPMGRDDAF